LWQRKIAKDGCSKSAARKAGYRWLAGQLGIPFEKCHIGYMSVEECQRVVEICTQATKRPTTPPTKEPTA
ncbi:MAG: zinc-finger-containing protein, partial [Pseudomonadota bacterium]